MNNRRHLTRGKWWVAVALILFSLSAFVAGKEDLFLIGKNLDIFSAVYRQVTLNYVDETNPDVLVKTAVDAMLNGLDPYTEYVQEKDVEDYKLKYVDTRYAGIGIVVLTRNNRVYIQELYAGYPADLAGLQVGDELIGINEEALSGKTGPEISYLLRGAAESKVRLRAKKAGSDQVEELTLSRRLVRQPNISYSSLLKNDIGYIKLDKFLEQSAKEMEDTLRQLQHEVKLNGVIVDLRNNGGGIVQEAVKIVNLFVRQGELVVSQRGKNASKAHSYYTTAEPVAAQVPLVILINQRSASAAEIVAGALQDLDRAVIIGERSFGKGLVQQTFNVPYNNLVKVTVARYYTPSGRCIQALDFVHREADGRYPRLSDSLIHAFNTKQGRTVYDGSGIHPDITVEQLPYATITQSLLSQYLVFDYATDFFRHHTSLPPVSVFEPDEALFTDFLRFLDQRQYQYVTKTEASLQTLQHIASSEQEPEDVIQAINALQQKIDKERHNELHTHRFEIQNVLGAELVSRYYHATGRAMFLLKYDQQLQQALSVLTESGKAYYSILSGEGPYQTIGRPALALAASQKIPYLYPTKSEGL